MECIFDKREYDGQILEYVIIKNNKYLELGNGQWFNIKIDDDNSVITHNFRIIQRFDGFHKNKTYTEYYYIDNHTIDIDRTKGLLKLIAENNEKIAVQNETLEHQATIIQEQSDIIDSILVQLLSGGNQ